MRNATRSITFVLLLTSSLLISCQKELPDENLKYIGSWGSNKYSLEIWKDGRGVCERINWNTNECRVIIEDGIIKFRGPIIKNFTIDREPYVDINGYRTMVLNGDTFIEH